MTPKTGLPGLLRPRIRLKSADEIVAMRPACQLVAQVLTQVRAMVRPGVTTGELDAFVEGFFAERGAKPLFKGYPGKTPFPASACISVNEEVVHGIPSPDRVLQEGDIISLDVGALPAGVTRV